MTNSIRILFVSALVLVSLSTAQAGKENMTPDAQNIDSACTADAATANCGSVKVGTGLLRCLHAYKKANKGFKFSEPCKTAMKQGRADRKAAKGKI